MSPSFYGVRLFITSLHVCTVHKWRLKHFIIQQMHKYIIRRYNWNYYKIFKIFKIPPTGFGSQGILNQGALYSASLHCAVHTQCLSTLCSTQTVPLYTMQYTHSAPLHCAVHTQYLSTLCSTQTVPLYTVQYTHSASLHCAVHTQCVSRLCSTHTVPL